MHPGWLDFSTSQLLAVFFLVAFRFFTAWPRRSASMLGGKKVHPASADEEKQNVVSHTSIQFSKDLGDVNDANKSESSENDSKSEASDSEFYEDQLKANNGAAADSNAVRVCDYRMDIRFKRIFT